MEFGAITSYVDVAQLVLYAFWAFFFGLIYYLVRENHREGYPMQTEDGRGVITGWPVPEPKTYLLQDGTQVQSPSFKPDRSADPKLALERAYNWAGSPLLPTGDPFVDGVGPGAWTEREDICDMTWEGKLRITPLRSAPEFNVSEHDTDPRGLPVVCADGEVAGKVVDLWLDHSEAIFRFIEVEVTANGRRVLLPMNLARVTRDAVKVRSVKAAHFAGVPALRNPDKITRLEEDRLFGWFGAGTLYADPARLQPLV